jgi:acetyl-CoA carboxylase biotin carboxyl carrier protein
MAEYKDQIDALSSLIEEFRLEEATLSLNGLTICFSKRREVREVGAETALPIEELYSEHDELEPEGTGPTAAGVPVTSPMNGIFYRSASPGSPPFFREGDEVAAGQTIGLIEAMKVFNEIPSPVSGVVLEWVAEAGALVQPGEVLLRIG